MENLRTGGIVRRNCPQGHPYSEENSYFYKGNRRCRKCISLRVCRIRRLRTLKRKLIKDLGEELGIKTYEEVKGRYKKV